MPKLEGPEDLGARPSVRTGAGVVRIDTSAVADAVARFGQTMQQTGAALRAGWQETKSYEAATALRQFEFDEQKRLDESVRNLAPDQASGFAERYNAEYQEHAKAFSQQYLTGLNPEQQFKFDSRLFDSEQALYGAASKFEREQQYTFANAQLDDSLNSVVLPSASRAGGLPAGDPRKLGELARLEQEAFALIDANPALTRIEKEERKRQTRASIQKTFALAMPPEERAGLDPSHSPMVGDTAEILRAEEGFRSEAYWDVNAYRAGYGSDTVTRADGTIEKVTKDTVITQEDAERDLSRRVSEFAADAAGDIGQDTWNSLPDNVRAGLVSVAYNYGSLPSSVVKAAQTGDAAEIARAVSKLGANPARRQREAALIRGGSDWATTLDALTIEDRLTLAQDGTTAVAAEQKQAYETSRNTLMTDILAGNAGMREVQQAQAEGWLTDFSHISQAVALAEAQESKVLKERSLTLFHTMPNAEIEAAVNGLALGADAENPRRMEAITDAADEVMKARETDPAKYVREAFPAVGQAWARASDGSGSTEQAIAVSTLAQQQLGFDTVKPLPAEMSSDVVKKFKNVDAPEDERVQSVVGSVFATSDPAQQQLIFEQLVADGLPEQTEGAVEAWARGDVGAGRRLFLAAMVDPTKLPGTIPGNMTPAEINDAIHSEIMEEGTIGDVYYGLSGGTAENYERARRDEMLLSNSVRLRMLDGETLDQALDGVTRDLYGDVQVVTGNSEVNAELLLPADEDPTPVLKGLTELLPDVRHSLTQTLTLPEGTIADNGERAVVGSVTEDYVDRVVAEGYFRNAEGGFVFIDPFLGTAVGDADGNAVIFRIRKPPALSPDERQPSTQTLMQGLIAPARDFTATANPSPLAP